MFLYWKQAVASTASILGVTVSGLGLKEVANNENILLKDFLSRASFELITTKEEWEKVFKKEGESQTTNWEEFENLCNSALDSYFQVLDMKYRNLILNCTKTTSFKDRLANLGLSLLSTENKTNSTNVDEAIWKNKWDNYEVRIRYFISDPYADTWVKARKKVFRKCKSVSEERLTTTTKTENWREFLQICVKEEANFSEYVKNNFWTNSKE